MRTRGIFSDARQAASLKTPIAMKTSLRLAISILLGSSAAIAGESARVRWGSGLLTQKPGWYASDEARAAANNVLRYQSREGGWPKNTDLLAPATENALAQVQKDGKANTIDNGATTLPIRFLAFVANMDRDSKPLYDFMQVGYERRSGYGYHGTAPAVLIEKDYPAWRARSIPERSKTG